MRKIYGCLIAYGILVGWVLTIKGFEPHAEFEPFFWYEKAKIIILFTIMMVVPYLAGREDMKTNGKHGN